jgi:lipopolysaccharide export system permease protein
MPAAFLIAAAHFILADQVVPRTQRALDLFNAQSEERKATRADEEGRTIWLRDGHQLVRVDYVVDEGRKLFGISLFDRSSEGQLRGRTLADNAEHRNGFWVLRDVQRLTFGQDGVADFETLATWRWDTLLTPQQFRELSLPPSRLSLTENLNFIENPGYATHPPHLYKTWVHERLSAPFATFIMVLLAGPIAGRVSRQGGMGRSLALGVLFGFAFFISDGLLLAMGESGKLPPILATWTPVAAFSCLGLGLLIHQEGW